MRKVPRSTSPASRGRPSPGLSSSGSEKPFFRSLVQPKLTINAPGDAYEQEADRVAESVMRMSAPGPVGVGTERPPESATTPLLRKCRACAEEEQLQREPAHDDEVSPEEVRLTPTAAGMPVQRLAIDCATFSRPPEEIDAEDAAELEIAPAGAEAATEGGIQRKCERCAREDALCVQRQEEGGSENTDSSFEESLKRSRGGGDRLPDGTRDFMERRLAADFSGVRVHSDERAASLSSRINAHAFTQGQNVYFNRGQYDPGSSGGQRLLAHELAHVVQQNGDTVRRRHRQPTGSTPDIQRSFYFSPHPKGNNFGSLVHRTVLPLFVAANPDLFIEVSIPGANKKDVDKGKRGVADFYRASTTIGLRFDSEPKTLNRDRDFQAGTSAHAAGANFDHVKHSAPRAFRASPRVRRMNLAPRTIEIGDLKPGASAESVLAETQIGNYKSGINATKTSLNSYLSTRSGESDSPTGSWSPTPTTMTRLTIPSDLRYTLGSGVRGLQNRTLALFREGDSRPHLLLDMKGTLYVYGDRTEGVWAYEWIPDNVPTSVGSEKVNRVLNRLNTDVIPALTATQGTSIGPKRAPAGQYPLMRKPRRFSDEDWKKKLYNPWKKEATRTLDDKSEVKKAEVGVGILDVEKRSRLTVAAPESLKAQGKGLPKLRHWKRFGKFYGWAREKFDVLYVKVKGLVESVKKKVRNLARRVGSSSFGSWIKAVAKVVFKIFKMVGSWIVTQVMDKLLASLREGVMKNVSKLIERAMPDDAKKYLEEFCAQKEKYDAIIAQKEEDLIGMLFGDRLKMFETADEIEKKIGYVADIATLVEWGVRILACASPPAVGCLWNLAISALQWAFARLLQTCWFTKEVYGPVISKVNLVREFPSELASNLVSTFNEQLPVPAGLDPWFAPVTVNIADFEVDCNEAADGGARMTADRRAILDLATRDGRAEELNSAVELMLQRGAGPWVLLDRARVEKLKKALETTPREELTAAISDREKPVPPAMQELIGEIGTYTAREKKVMADWRVAQERKAAEAALEREIGEILKDEKAQEALARPFPSNDQLKKDLDAVDWGPVPVGSGRFVSVAGRTIVALKTETGARTGAYFKYFVRDVEGSSMNMILEVGDFFALDAIPTHDSVTFTSTDLKGNPGIAFLYFPAVAQGTFVSRSQAFFFGKYVDFD
jgi:hypothetical protein